MAEIKKETWKNATNGNVGITKFDVKGNEVGTVVRPGKTVTLTVDERRLNQDYARSTASDLFSNGTLSPIRLIDDPEIVDSAEYKAIEDNPNFISETEMAELFNVKRIDHFKKRLEGIENVTVLSRIRQMASAQDAKVSQIDAIEARLAELRPNNVVEVTTVGGSEDRKMKPATA
jgi:hypothetical protein